MPLDDAPVGHSPLGGSATHRFMKCPGSVTLSRGTEDDESEHAARGTAAHKLGELCLITVRDAWTFIGEEIAEGFKVDKDMADAVQVYVDWIRKEFGRHLANTESTLIEHHFHCPTLHPLYYGSLDFGRINLVKRELTIVDYKHGMGVVVEVPWNPQCLYYAGGIMEKFDLWQLVDTVRIVIAQPRGWHYAGPVREWTISTKDLDGWLVDTLLPAMDRAMVSNETVSGEHCRFCPARFRACPQLKKDVEEFMAMADKIKAASNIDPSAKIADKAEAAVKGANELTNAEVERYLELEAVMKIVSAAVKKTAFNRLQHGATFEKWKLGPAKVNREWKPEAEAALIKEYGAEAWKPSELKSPAEIETLPRGKDLAARYAFKPEAGLTLVPMSDARPAVNRDTKSLFQPVKKSRN
jgi:hypothetical protein